MRQIPIPEPLPVGLPHRVIAMNTGHHRLADGHLLRVDVELGRFVGTLYTPDMHVRTQVHGTAATVHAWADAVAAGFPARLPV